MTTKVLVLDIHAEIYRDRLQAEFPALQFMLAHNIAEVPEDVSDVDVLLTFGIEVKDFLFARAARLKWIQSLATVLYMMMAVSRDVTRRVEDNQSHVWGRRFWSILCGKTALIAGVGIVG